MKERTITPVPDPRVGDQNPAANEKQAGKKPRFGVRPVAMPLPEFTNKGVPAVDGTAPHPVATASASDLEATTQLVPPQTDVTTAAKHSLPPDMVLAEGIDSDREFRVIDARLVDQNINPPRQLYSDYAIQSLAESLKADGQRDPIHVIPHPSKPGRFIIGDGWTRVQAVRAYNINNCEVLACIHLNLNEIEASWLGYNQNEKRTPPTDYDRSVFYKELNRNGMSWEEIAERSGVSKAQISNFAAYERLPSELIALVKQHPEKISANAARLMARLNDEAGEATAIKIGQRFVNSDHTVAWLREQLEAVVDRAAAPRRKANSVAFQRKFQAGHYRQRSNGQVELNVVIPPSRIEEFNTGIQELLKSYVNIDTVPNQAPDVPTGEAPGDKTP